MTESLDFGQGVLRQLIIVLISALFVKNTFTVTFIFVKESLGYYKNHISFAQLFRIIFKPLCFVVTESQNGRDGITGAN